MCCDIPSCKKCSSDNVIKNGLRSLAQRYKCKDCKYSFTKHDGRTKLERRKKITAVFLSHRRLEMSITEIAKMFNIKEKTVEKWIMMEEERFLCEVYRNRMIAFRTSNEYYCMVQKLLNKYDDKNDEIKRLLLNKDSEYCDKRDRLRIHNHGYERRKIENRNENKRNSYRTYYVNNNKRDEYIDDNEEEGECYEGHSLMKIVRRIREKDVKHYDIKYE